MAGGHAPGAVPDHVGPVNGLQLVAHRGLNRNPPRYVRAMCGQSENEAMLVISSDLCQSGAYIAGYQDPVAMYNISIISKNINELHF